MAGAKVKALPSERSTRVREVNAIGRARARLRGGTAVLGYPPMHSPSPRSLVLVIALAATLYLVGNARVALWDRDEPRYAQTSRQMLQGGDWVVPRFLDKVRTAKPVFIYWCQASAMSVLGADGDTGVFAARLPSAVAMTLVLAVVAAALWRAFGPAHAFWATLVLATSALVAWSAKSSTTDAVLLLGVTVAQL